MRKTTATTQEALDRVEYLEQRYANLSKVQRVLELSYTLCFQELTPKGQHLLRGYMMDTIGLISNHKRYYKSWHTGAWPTNTFEDLLNRWELKLKSYHMRKRMVK